MDIIFRGDGPWGPGKGANLQAAEIDANFWEIAENILALQNDPPVPNGISSITVSGTQMTITLTDGTVMGPYTLPVLVFRWRDEWQPSTPYFELDVFKVTGLGIYLVEFDHTSGASFDPAIAVDGQPALTQLFGSTDASLSALPDVDVSNLQDGDALIWNDSELKWMNRFLASMAYQESSLVNITGGFITGLTNPINPNDAATKAYVDATVLAPSPISPAMMIANATTNIAAPIPSSLSDFLDVSLATTVRGTMLYRGPTGWTALAPGTSGLFLKTSGSGADPVWSVAGSGVTSVSAGAGITTGAGPITATGSVALAAIADNSLLANISGTTVAPSATTLSAILDRVMSSTRGSVLVRAGGGWVALAPGTAGYFLQTQGATADPQWASPAGAGTVTSVSAGTGISTGGAPITGAGTVSLAAIANLSVLANISGGSAAPVPATATQLFDALFGATQGAVLYRSATAWSMLSPGTSGQVLTTGGSSANPAWANAAAGAPIANLLLLANISGATAAASGNTLSNILDAVLGSSRGLLLYRGASGWAALAPGTSGQLLQTGGTAGDPSWVTGATGGGGGASITTSDTPPASPADGDAWWDSVAGQLYISYADADSQQWVPASNQPGPAGPTGATGPAGSANMTGMTAGQIPIAASATSVTSSANLSGDVTSNSSLATTLATVNANVGTFQGLTVNAKGLVTAASNQGYLTSAAAASTYLPLVGGTLNKPSGGDPLALVVAASQNCRIVYNTTSLRIWSAGIAGATGNFVINDETAGVTRLLVAGADGAVQFGSLVPFNNNVSYIGAPGLAYVAVYSYAFTNASDASLKSNIEAAPSAIADVAQLEPKTFTWKSGPDTERTHWGFLAQDVAAVLGEDFGGYLEGEKEGEKAIVYHELTAVLWRAVQEQWTALQAMRAELDALKAGAAR